MMKKILLVLLFMALTPASVFSLPSEVSASKLSWPKPIKNNDGSELTDLSGYYIYWKQSTVEAYDNSRRVTINDPNSLEYQIASIGLPTDGLYFAVMTAFNASGEEGGYGKEVNFTRRNGVYYRSTASGPVPDAPDLSVQ